MTPKDLIELWQNEAQSLTYMVGEQGRRSALLHCASQLAGIVGAEMRPWPLPPLNIDPLNYRHLGGKEGLTLAVEDIDAALIRLLICGASLDHIIGAMELLTHLRWRRDWPDMLRYIYTLDRVKYLRTTAEDQMRVAAGL